MTARQLRRVTPVTSGPPLPVLPPLEDVVPWETFALCAETDPDAFFPEKGELAEPAKRICRSCLVRTECLEFALDNDVRFGVWGGTAEGDRRKLRRTRRAEQQQMEVAA